MSLADQRWNAHGPLLRRAYRLILFSLGNPSAADHHVAVVENYRLAGRDGALWLVECDQCLAVGRALDRRRRRLMAMANLRRHSHGIAEHVDRDPVQGPGDRLAR